MLKKTHLARLLFIHNLLIKKRKCNCIIISKKYEISRRTILRDIEFMRDFLDLPIEYNSKKRSYEYIKDFNIKSDFLKIEILDLFFKRYKNNAYSM